MRSRSSAAFSCSAAATSFFCSSASAFACSFRSATSWACSFACAASFLRWRYASVSRFHAATADAIAGRVSRPTARVSFIRSS